MSLVEALAIVKAAGYRVSKPKPKKQTQVGPTCVTQFADGSIFRMTTHCPGDVLDWNRGMKLCAYAWESRNRSTDVPKMLSVHFERDGVLLGAPIVADGMAFETVNVGFREIGWYTRAVGSIDA